MSFLDKIWKKNKKEFDGDICAMTEGKLIPISVVKDPTFAEEILGKGFAIIPSEEIIVSPIEGTVLMVFDTKHAISIQTDDGLEILIHVGIDTVELGGEGFEVTTQVGRRVKKGDSLLRFDQKLIQEKGYDTCVILVITNSNDYAKCQLEPIDNVKAGTLVMKVEE